ncbi:RloB-like protein [Anaerolinea thermolimosa]|uniref:RloB family protein n=1 Tax=Anaerolinea thermolimosa TaxID=229919 RepID=UPI000784E55C|nr:RloB family protein [Anaerolinea thermolimosa]GAP06132.1 RloB-like protein [Anaerolinea thermolimosa]
MARTPKPSGRKLSPKGAPLRPRSIKQRELRQRFLIICEGKQTEPNYFKRFRVNAVVEAFGIGRSPLNIVKYAQNYWQKGDFDQAWVVFDFDNVGAPQFNQAIQQAKQAGLKVAYSNPCFEVWFLLHFGYYNTPMNRQQYINKLSQNLGRTYQKNDPSLYDELLTHQRIAISNAQRLLGSYNPHDPAKDDPSTTVHLLVKELNNHLIP